MTGWFEIAKNDKGQYSFVLKAANAQVILRSQQYESKASAQGGVASVQANSPRDERYLLATASDGRFYFNLRAANSQVIGTSQMYADRRSAHNRDRVGQGQRAEHRRTRGLKPLNAPRAAAPARSGLGWPTCPACRGR